MFCNIIEVAMEESLHFSQPPKARAAVILSCDQVTYIVNSGFWLGVGKEALAVYLIKKRNVRLGTVSVRFQWLLDDCID